jgi:hypothetical protein
MAETLRPLTTATTEYYSITVVLTATDKLVLVGLPLVLGAYVFVVPLLLALKDRTVVCSTKCSSIQTLTVTVCTELGCTTTAHA